MLGRGRDHRPQERSRFPVQLRQRQRCWCGGPFRAEPELTFPARWLPLRRGALLNRRFGGLFLQTQCPQARRLSRACSGFGVDDLGSCVVGPLGLRICGRWLARKRIQRRYRLFVVVHQTDIGRSIDLAMLRVIENAC